MSRRTSIVRKTGKGDYQFQPGESLDEHALYVELDESGEEHDRFEINHHAYRLHQSRCFQDSDGELNCLTCHDPHAKVAASQRTAHFRSRCLSCHGRSDCLDVQNGHAPDADCVSCHMSVRRTQDVVHVVMTDHKIARRSKLADPTAELAEAEVSSDLPIRPYTWADQAQSADDQQLSLTIARLRDRDPTLLAQLTWPLPVAARLTPEAQLELGIELAQAVDHGARHSRCRHAAWTAAGWTPHCVDPHEFGHGLHGAWPLSRGCSGVAGGT